MDSSHPRILLLDSEAERSAQTASGLLADGPAAEVVIVADAEAWKQALTSPGWTMVVVELDLPWSSAAAVLQAVRERWPECSVIVYTDINDAEQAATLTRMGLHDYILRSSPDALSRLRPSRPALTTRSERDTHGPLQHLQTQLDALSAALRGLGADPLENIKRLTELAGRLLSASCALYNRLDQGVLCTWGQWSTPPDYDPISAPEGHICYDVIRQGNDDVVVVTDLPHTPYADTDPNVKRFDLKTYIGKGVKFEDAYVGSLCAVYQQHYEPTDDDKRLLILIASAISVEEKRKQAEDALAQRVEELTGLYEISLEMTAKESLPALLDAIMTRASELLKMPLAAVQLLDDSESVLELVGAYHRDEKDPAAPSHLGTKTRLGEGLTGRVAQTGRPMTINNYQDWPGQLSAFQDLALKRVMGVPLRQGNTILGVLNIADNEKSDPFTESQVRLASLFANQAAVAITYARLLEAERRRSDEFETLRLASLQLTSSLALQPVLTALLEYALKLVSADDAHIFLFDGENLSYGASRWANGRVRAPYTQPRRDGLTATVVRTGKRLVVPDTDQHLLYKDWQWGGAIVGLPLKFGGRVRGVMNIAYLHPHHFAQDELRVLEFLADQAAIAIQNAQLYDQVQRHAQELEQKIAERTTELQTVNEQLRHLDQMRGQFVSNVSHEFRTPLANISLLLELLDILPGDQHGEHIGTLRRETELLRTLIEDLLDLSRLDQGRVKLNSVPVEINMLVTDLVSDRLGLIAQHGLTLEACPAPDLPRALADPGRLLQVITNLLTNAMNYTAAGGRIAICTRLEISQGKEWVNIVVSDTGRGIPEDELPRIFQRFYRGAAARRSGVPGTGLGLAICDELIQRQGGFITIESEVGVGSTFAVWLPVADSPSPQR